MKKITYLIFLVLILFSCSTSIKSITDTSVIMNQYTKPIVTITLDDNSSNYFTVKLIQDLEVEFDKKQIDSEFLIFKKSSDQLTLNKKSIVEEKITNSILKNNNDLLLVFRPTSYQSIDGSINSAKMELVGIDTKTKKEVWKAILNSEGFFGLSAKAAAKKLFEKLRADRVL